MSFNLFGPATKCDIRVGYISTTRGYVDGISRLEANKYAKLNPGTQFILRRRDKIKFMNINEVNKLEPKDFIPANSASGDNVCPGITGLDIYEEDGSIRPEVFDNKNPVVVFSGGGGIGAKANPVFGNDGSLLAVDLIEGGWGYVYPPITQVIDGNGIGAGAVIRSIMVGDPEYPNCKFIESVQTFENEEDFEEYDLATCAPSQIVTFGSTFDADGNEVGEWNPRAYATLKGNPIELEIKRYQDFLASLRGGSRINLRDNIIRNWWTTRKEKPLKVTALNKKSRTVHKVVHPAWDDSDENNRPRKDENYIDVVFKVFSSGANKRNLRFIFASEDGKQKFTIKADDFKDRREFEITKKIKKNLKYNVSSIGDIEDTGKAGRGVEQGLVGYLGKSPGEKNNKKSGNVIFCDFRNTANDNDDLQVECKQGKFTASGKDKSLGRSTFTLTYEFEDIRTYKDLKDSAEKSFMNRNAISPVPPSNVPGSDFAGIEHTLEWEEDFPYDGDYVFRYLADNVADVYLDNELIGRTKSFRGSPDKLKRFVTAGVHKIRVDLENIPQFKTISKQRKEKEYIETEFEVYGQGSQKHRAIKFSFTSEGGDHSFVLDNAQGNRKTYKKTIKVLRNTDYKVVAIADSAPEKASNRRAYGIEYEGLNNRNNPLGKRLHDNNKTLKLLDGDGDDTNASFRIVSTSPGLKAQFSDDASRLIVTGQSKGDVTLKLSWDDNPNFAGVAVKKIKIGDTQWIQSGEKNSVSRTININKIVNTVSNSGIVEQGTMQTFAVREKERGNKPSKIIFADYVGSVNDNDDMQIRVNRGIFTPTNKKRISGVGPQGNQTRGTFDLSFRVNIKPEQRGSNSSNSGFEMEEIFNSKEFIKKADRKLWRLNPKAGRDGDFLSRYGVLPFNPDTKKATTDDFDGTHIIRWETVDFPITGNYNFEIMADDSATIFIGNRAGGGQKAIGNRLREISSGGDEVIIKKQGFSAPGRSTGKSFETEFFEKGKYRIRVELKQVRGKPLAEGNPMAFAMRIRTTFKEKRVVSSRSWNQNPMGIALTIDAPLPPVPQEPKPEQEGRCPNNPLWTTRFPGSEDQWFPVTHPAWSAFTNRYGMSPVLPLSTPDSDNGGQLFRTSWVIEAPYDGFYGMKGTVDNGGRILVDDRVILKGGTGFNGRTLKGFKEDFPDTVKFSLEEGKHTITVEVINQTTETFKTVKNKIFSTKDWLTDVKTNDKEGEHPITYIGLNSANKNVTVKDTSREFGITYKTDADDFGLEVKSSKRIIFDDNARNGFDTNSSFEIKSTSPGINAKFNNDGSKLIVTGKKEGNVTLKLSYDDDPENDGTAIKEINLAGKTWRSTSEKGEITLTVDVSGSGTSSQSGGKIQVSSNGKKISLRDSDGKDTNTSFTIISGDGRFSKDGRKIEGKGEVSIKLNWDDDPNKFGVAVEQIKIRDVTWTQSGEEGSQSRTVTLGSSKSKGLKSGKKDGVKYVGPTELATYRKGLLSPLFQDINNPTEEIQGKTFIMRWEKVDFPVDGRYDIKVECDDVAEVFVEGERVARARLGTVRDNGELNTYRKFNATKGKKTVEIRLTNARIPNTSFQQNPTYVKVDITTNTEVSTGRSRPWTTNPIGISAVLIPPPCPLKIVGKGKICQVLVDDPGNGYPIPPLLTEGGSQYPVIIELTGITITNPGINYNCGVDQLVIEPNNGVRLEYECDTFGRITKVTVEPPLGPDPADPPPGDPDSDGRPSLPFGTSRTPPPPLPFGRGYDRTPQIRMITDTGINFQAVPVFNVVRDPVDPDILPEQILQVTDLVGLKQTGYINGRPYYGQVFYKNGIRYAGVYETPGQLIQVYDTLKESIDAEVTTPPSATLRQGTDISSNDPRLNIPGTPDSLS